ncbi:MAG: hypothetical protein NC924_10410, partial [Candidatus Omnitrophica bacterium]|nr:hypothetical protein [Candidatus Omnitrophota bacterium]
MSSFTRGIRNAPVDEDVDLLDQVEGVYEFYRQHQYILKDWLEIMRNKKDVSEHTVLEAARSVVANLRGSGEDYKLLMRQMRRLLWFIDITDKSGKPRDVTLSDLPRRVDLAEGLLRQASASRESEEMPMPDADVNSSFGDEWKDNPFSDSTSGGVIDRTPIALLEDISAGKEGQETADAAAPFSSGDSDPAAGESAAVPEPSETTGDDVDFVEAEDKPAPEPEPIVVWMNETSPAPSNNDSLNGDAALESDGGSEVKESDAVATVADDGPVENGNEDRSAGVVYEEQSFSIIDDKKALEKISEEVDTFIKKINMKYPGEKISREYVLDMNSAGKPLRLHLEMMALPATVPGDSSDTVLRPFICIYERRGYGEPVFVLTAYPCAETMRIDYCFQKNNPERKSGVTEEAFDRMKTEIQTQCAVVVDNVREAATLYRLPMIMTAPYFLNEAQRALSAIADDEPCKMSIALFQAVADIAREFNYYVDEPSLRSGIKQMVKVCKDTFSFSFPTMPLDNLLSQLNNAMSNYWDLQEKNKKNGDVFSQYVWVRSQDDLIDSKKKILAWLKDENGIVQVSERGALFGLIKVFGLDSIDQPEKLRERAEQAQQLLAASDLLRKHRPSPQLSFLAEKQPALDFLPPASVPEKIDETVIGQAIANARQGAVSPNSVDWPTLIQNNKGHLWRQVHARWLCSLLRQAPEGDEKEMLQNLDSVLDLERETKNFDMASARMLLYEHAAEIQAYRDVEVEDWSGMSLAEVLKQVLAQVLVATDNSLPKTAEILGLSTFAVRRLAGQLFTEPRVVTFSDLDAYVEDMVAVYGAGSAQEQMERDMYAWIQFQAGQTGKSPAVIGEDLVVFVELLDTWTERYGQDSEPASHMLIPEFSWKYPDMIRRFAEVVNPFVLHSLVPALRFLEHPNEAFSPYRETRQYILREGAKDKKITVEVQARHMPASEIGKTLPFISVAFSDKQNKNFFALTVYPVEGRLYLTKGCNDQSDLTDYARAHIHAISRAAAEWFPEARGTVDTDLLLRMPICPAAVSFYQMNRSQGMNPSLAFFKTVDDMARNFPRGEGKPEFAQAWLAHIQAMLTVIGNHSLPDAMDRCFDAYAKLKRKGIDVLLLYKLWLAQARETNKNPGQKWGYREIFVNVQNSASLLLIEKELGSLSPERAEEYRMSIGTPIKKKSARTEPNVGVAAGSNGQEQAALTVKEIMR